MKVASIVPVNYLESIAKDDYHMCLAQFYNRADMRPYYEFYRKQAEKGAFVILDNGTAEGATASVEHMIAVANVISPSEVVIPDSLQDADVTLQWASDYMGKLRFCLPNTRLMGVAQGETLEEWVCCAQALLHMGIDTLGVPKILVKTLGRNGRATALLALYKKDPQCLEGKQIHLLGCWEDAFEAKVISNLVRQGRLPEVRGIDSCLPYIHSVAGQLMDEGPRPDVHMMFTPDSPQVDKWLLGENIHFWKIACNVMPLDPNIPQMKKTVLRLRRLFRGRNR